VYLYFIKDVYGFAMGASYGLGNKNLYIFFLKKSCLQKCFLYKCILFYKKNPAKIVNVIIKNGKDFS